MSCKQRLMKLEKGSSQDFSEIRTLIRKGTFYDELTETQKADYEKYKCSLGGVAVDIASAELDILFNDTPRSEAFHFKLSKRQPPPTREELAERIEEVQEILLNME